MNFTQNPLIDYNLEDGAIVQYIESFLTEDFSKNLYDSIMQNVNFEQSVRHIFGKNIPIPRLQSWMSDDGVKANLYQKQKGLPWSEEIMILRNKLEELTSFKFDYVLINLYRDGQDSIGFHSDNESIGEDKNIICSISLGATRKFLMRHVQWKEKNIKKNKFYAFKWKFDHNERGCYSNLLESFNS